MALAKFFQALGLPTTNGNGHELGCTCAGCQDHREKSFARMRVRHLSGAKPKTLGEILASVLDPDPKDRLH
jgi:hypothetical protein